MLQADWHHNNCHVFALIYFCILLTVDVKLIYNFIKLQNIIYKNGYEYLIRGMKGEVICMQFIFQCDYTTLKLPINYLIYNS